MSEEQTRQLIREELAFMIKGKKLVFPFPMQILNGNDITLGTGLGTRIGTATTQKLGLFGVTPVVQAGAISSPSGGATQDSQARTAIDSIRTALTAIGITA